MKKQISSILLLLSSAFLLAACGEGNGESSPSGNDSSLTEQKIVLSKTNVSLEQYESVTLTYELQNLSGSVAWESSDTAIATVTNGKVEALKVGNCTITASIGNVKATCSITVSAISQAPRIVMSDLEVSVDKDQTYAIDAYVTYKGEIIDATLEMSLKDGESDAVASLKYENSQIKVTGLSYGEATYIIHTKVKGITLSQTLKVKVANSSLRLALNNLEDGENGYELNLATYKFEGEGGYETEFTPDIVFTEKGVKAEYALKYTSSNDGVAAWENGKIVAKSKGNAVMKVECEEFALSLEIKVNVSKGAYDVTLKNATTDGSDKTVKVAPNKLPSAPSIDSRKFVGWYDSDGDKVENVTDDMTLIAHYSKEYDYANNEILKTFTHTASDYETVDGVEPINVRGQFDSDDDIANGRYPNIEGSAVLFTWQEKVDGVGAENTYTGEEARRLPAFDFSSSGPVVFTFGSNNGNGQGNFYLEDNDCGTNASGVYAHKVTINGNSMSIYNVGEDKTYTYTLSDDVYTGKKGIKVSITNAPYGYFVFSPFRSLLCDYIGEAMKIESDLPDTPTVGDGYIEKIADYKEMRTLYTDVENGIYPISSKMQAWIDASTPSLIHEFTDQGASVISSLAGSGKTIATQGSGYSIENSIQIAMNGMDGSYITMTLPAIKYSDYAKVTFTMGLGGGPGDRAPKYWLGTIPETATKYPVPDSLTKLDNFIGVAPSCDPTGNNWNTEFTNVSVVGKKISFKSSSIDKTLDLDDDVYNGTKGLVLTVGWCSYNTFVITPLYASKI